MSVAWLSNTVTWVLGPAKSHAPSSTGPPLRWTPFNSVFSKFSFLCWNASSTHSPQPALKGMWVCPGSSCLYFLPSYISISRNCLTQHTACSWLSPANSVLLQSHNFLCWWLIQSCLAEPDILWLKVLALLPVGQVSWHQATLQFRARKPSLSKLAGHQPKGSGVSSSQARTLSLSF